MRVKIYKSQKTAMQSGRAKAGTWVLEYEKATARRPEPLMGWSASADTLNQVKLNFESEQDAITFADEKGWYYDLRADNAKRIQPRSYMDNFKFLPPPSDNA